MSLLLCRFLGIPLTPDTGNRYVDRSFSQYLLSIAGQLRLQMHTTGLFLGVFAALGLAGLLWVIAEKWQRRSPWDRRDVIWMAVFEAFLMLCAFFYRAGTNSEFARRFAMSRTIADVLGIGVAIAVPIILWSRWNGPKQLIARRDEEESFSHAHSRTILGLQDYSPPVSQASPLPERKHLIEAQDFAVLKPPVGNPAESIQEPSHPPSEPEEEQIRSEATVMDNLSISNINEQPTTPQPAAAQPETPQPYAPAPATPQPFAAQPAPSQYSTPPQPISSQPPTPTMAPPMPERPSSPSATFREQLYALNASWHHIEETGKEVEQWFQLQQRRVMAHLERPATKSHDIHPDLSRDFLERKMDQVDDEWAAIHRTVRDMYRWLENGNGDKTVPQESKVW